MKANLKNRRVKNTVRTAPSKKLWRRFPSTRTTLRGFGLTLG